MRRELLVGFLLVAAVALVYWPVHSYPFVILDDPGYVSQNPLVRQGLTPAGVTYAFTGVTLGNWHPLTMLSLMLDCEIYGAKETSAGGYHVTNLILHAANTLLLFIALRVMTGAVWRSGLVAALFGLHPLHVESVAWISERKDVLSTFFFMLLLLAYHAYARRPSLWRYAAVFVLLLCGLMSKPMLVTAPFVLLLLDYWPLGRMKAGSEEQGAGSEEQGAGSEEQGAGSEEQGAGSEEQGAGSEEQVDDSEEDAAASDETPPESEATLPAPRSTLPAFWPLVAEKIPLFVLVVLSALVTWIAQAGSGAMGMLGHVPLMIRLENAVCAYGIYLEKVFWPRPLAAMYTYTPHNWTDVLVIAAALVAISVAAYRLAKLQPYLPVGWWWYVITLLPVIGLVQVGLQSMADRYTYIPLIGPFIIAAWGGAELVESLSARSKAAAIAAAAAVLCFFTWFTSQQLKTWSSSEALCRAGIEAAPDSYFFLDTLGMIYWQESRLEEARMQFQAIVNLETDPRFRVQGGLEPGHRALGMLLAAMRRPKEAIEELDKAIALKPKQPDARRHKAWLLATYPDERFRNGAEALRLANEAMALSRGKPAEYWDTLAVAHAEMGNFKEAIATEEEAISTARKSHAGDLLPGLEERLNKFKAGLRYHAAPGVPLRL